MSAIIVDVKSATVNYSICSCGDNMNGKFCGAHHHGNINGLTK